MLCVFDFPSLCVAVDGLPLGIQCQELKDHCSEASPVLACSVSGSSGRVRYETHEEVQNAIAMLDESWLCGLPISVVGGSGTPHPPNNISKQRKTLRNKKITKPQKCKTSKPSKS